MSGSDIRDILQLGSPTEPIQKRSKPVPEKRPGTERERKGGGGIIHRSTHWILRRWH